MKPIYGIFLRAGGWIAVLFVWLGLIIAVSGIVTLRNATRLASNGEITTAEITKKTAHSSGRSAVGDTLPSGTDYFVEYLLTTPEGPLAGKAKVDRSYYGLVNEGGVVSVRYLPQSPKVHELYEGALLRSGQATTVVGSALTALGLLITLGFGFTAKSGARLLQSGASAQATVLKKTRVLFLTRLRFGFKQPNGHAEKGKSFWRFERAHRGIKARDMVEVKYDSSNPRTSFWQGDLTRRT